MKPPLPTDPERWRRIEDLLDEAFERPAGERRAFLDEACAQDPELRAHMEDLLTAGEEAGDFLAHPVKEAAAALLADTSGGAPSPADRVLGPYRLVREIGSGGMGVVYEAEDDRLRRRVAIKLLPPEYSRDPAAKERFVREARAASALDDPNICTVHDIGECDGQLFIVMAYYEGETLKERLAKGPLPIAEARQVAIEVARALARAHEAGIVHRDIKPANVMLTRRGKVKILDFGIAKITGDTSLTRTGGSPGTPAYMSPEQVRGEVVDGRSDLWALGVLLYEMLAGRRPFPGEDERAVLSAIQDREPEPLARLRPEVPPELARTVAKALAKDPAKRYADAAELLADLEAGSRTLALRRWRRRRFLRPALLASSVTALVLLVGLVLKELPWHSGPPPRVAILSPVMFYQGENPDFRHVASDVVEAILAALISLEGVQPLDPPELDKEKGSTAQISRRADANEAISSLLDCEGSWCRITLHRLKEPGNVVLETQGPFEIQTGIENIQGFAEGVRGHLHLLYPDFRVRPESRTGEVKPEDYSSYMKLEHRAASGERLTMQELDQLDALLRTSPGLLGAYRLAIDSARKLRATDRALAYATRAEAIAPNDPQLLFSHFRAEIAGELYKEAEVTLKRLSDLVPDDARVPRARADLLEKMGQLKEAYPLRLEVFRRRPAWPQIVELATLEYRLGESDIARSRIEPLLEAQPDNRYLLEAVAVMGSQYGDLEQSGELYEKLIRVRSEPMRRNFTNLGFIRYLLGDYAAAETAHRRALSLEPRHVITRFSLATALEAQGKLTEALRLYRDLAEEFAASSKPLDLHTRLLHAQCLVRLGRKNEASRLTEEVLARRPEEIQIFNQAAQVYTLLGERLSALYYMERVRKKGLRREWFTIPEFASLKEDPDFQALLKSPLPASP